MPCTIKRRCLYQVFVYVFLDQLEWTLDSERLIVLRHAIAVSDELVAADLSYTYSSVTEVINKVAPNLI